jgi:hypothetical protein
MKGDILRAAVGKIHLGPAASTYPRPRQTAQVLARIGFIVPDRLCHNRRLPHTVTREAAASDGNCVPFLRQFALRRVYSVLIRAQGSGSGDRRDGV